MSISSKDPGRVNIGSSLARRKTAHPSKRYHVALATFNLHAGARHAASALLLISRHGQRVALAARYAAPASY
jgi:hypothetical protein